MSTKSTMAHSAGKFHLYEEMVSETVWLAIFHPEFIAESTRLDAQLSQEIVGAILEANEKKLFPWQRKADDDTEKGGKTCNTNQD